MPRERVVAPGVVTMTVTGRSLTVDADRMHDDGECSVPVEVPTHTVSRHRLEEKPSGAGPVRGGTRIEELFASPTLELVDAARRAPPLTVSR